LDEGEGEMTLQARRRPAGRIATGLATVIAAGLIVSPGHGQGRPSTVNRPCAASQALVTAHGAIVLGTGGFTYDRFVRDGNFCEVGEYTDPAFVPSLDTPYCFVGYLCKQGPRDLFAE
jgi:hypothetical protein